MIPSNNDLRAVDPVLTNMLVAYRNMATDFVAGRAFPVVPVDQESGTYYLIERAQWLSDQLQERPPGGDFARSGFGVSTDTYQTIQWGLEKTIPDEHRRTSQLPADLERVTIEWLGDQSLIRKERAFAASFMVTGAWTTEDNNSATDWDDYASGDPVTNVRTAKRTVRQLIARAPNLLIVGEVVHDALANHPDIIDRLKYTTAATAGSVEAGLAAVLGVDNYVVGAAIYNSADEGQSATLSPIIDDDALLLYATPSPGLLVPSAGYTLAWPGAGADGMIDTYREEKVKSDIVRLNEAWVQKQVSADAGYLWLDIV